MYLFRVVIDSFQCSRGRVGESNLAYGAHDASFFQPRIQFASAEIPEAVDFVRWNLAKAGHALQRLYVHPAKKFGGVFVVQERLKKAVNAGCHPGRITDLLHLIRFVSLLVILVGTAP